MKLFEIGFNYSRYFLSPLYLFVYKTVKQLVKLKDANVSLLDVGGRKSHHTINIPAEITVTDIPRESNIQTDLHLGTNEDIINQLYSRRSNIKEYLIDNMVDTKLPKESFDIIMAIEVLEHVKEDKLFIKNVYETLKPGGIFFMTTPNGDHVINTNPDHVRHYTKKQLLSVLNSSFNKIDINYTIFEGKFYFYSLNSWSIRQPLKTVCAMLSSLINNYQSKKVLYPYNSRHLSAIAIKK